MRGHQASGRINQFWITSAVSVQSIDAESHVISPETVWPRPTFAEEGICIRFLTASNHHTAILMEDYQEVQFEMTDKYGGTYTLQIYIDHLTKAHIIRLQGEPQGAGIRISPGVSSKVKAVLASSKFFTVRKKEGNQCVTVRM